MIEALPAEVRDAQGREAAFRVGDVRSPAPSASRVRTALVWPWRAASISAVRPSESRALLMFAPCVDPQPAQPATSPEFGCVHNWSGRSCLSRRRGGLRYCGSCYRSLSGMPAAGLPGPGRVLLRTTVAGAVVVAAAADARRKSVSERCLLSCWLAMRFAHRFECCCRRSAQEGRAPAEWGGRSLEVARARRLLLAELAASARRRRQGGCSRVEAGAGARGSAECSVAESGAGKAGADGCVTAAVGGIAAGADDRAGESVSAAGARATGGVAASGPEARTGAGAVKGFGGGARSGGTIRMPATAATTTAPPIIMARDGDLVAAPGALNLGACALAPCLTARSAAVPAAACASGLAAWRELARLARVERGDALITCRRRRPVTPGAGGYFAHKTYSLSCSRSLTLARCSRVLVVSELPLTIAAISAMVSSPSICSRNASRSFARELLDSACQGRRLTARFHRRSGAQARHS